MLYARLWKNQWVLAGETDGLPWSDIWACVQTGWRGLTEPRGGFLYFAGQQSERRSQMQTQIEDLKSESVLLRTYIQSTRERLAEGGWKLPPLEDE